MGYDASGARLPGLSRSWLCGMSVPFLLIFALFTIPDVSLSVSPSFAQSPATFRFLVLVPRHPDNRRICVSFDGPEMRLHCEDLDGDKARRSLTTYWSLRTAGEYEAVAVLTRIEQGREKAYMETRAFRVFGFAF